MSPDDLTRRHARAALVKIEAEYDAADLRILELQALGYRVISGGPDSGYDKDGVCDWSYTDWRTGEPLIAGRSTLAVMDDRMAEADPDGRWWHIYGIHEEFLGVTRVHTDGLPATLGAVIEDWVSSHHVPATELAEWVDWPVERVAAIRRRDGFPAEHPTSAGVTT